MCVLRLKNFEAFLRATLALDCLACKGRPARQKAVKPTKYALARLHANSHAPKTLVRRGKGAKLGPDTARSAVCTLS